MRNIHQSAVRKKRAEIANELLIWMENNQPTKGLKPYDMLVQFLEDKDYKIFDAWAAWDILRDAGRLKTQWHGHWELLGFTPVKLDDKGNIIQNDQVSSMP